MNDDLFDAITDVFSGFGWPAVFEVAILAFVIFALLRLVRGTSAMPVVRGIGIVVVAIVLVSRVFDLAVLSWLVNNALAVLALFVLIVFQPEFRRALERVGRTGVRSLVGVRRDGYDPLIDAVSVAAGELSAQRAGALMVIERETGLQEIADTGTPVDALPTPALLEGIFYPNSPLHDGAVLLRPERVVAAACTLPVSPQRTVRGAHVGLRHRAALGISEQTDAIAVVVSEETGAISVTMGGRLVQRLNEQRLRTLLGTLTSGAWREFRLRTSRTEA